MRILPSGVIEKYKIEICFVNLIILFYLFRTSVPLLKFPFLLLYSCFIAYSLINSKKQIISTLIEFVRNYYLLLFLALILVISFLLSNKLYLTIFKDVVNMIILLSLFFILTLIVDSKEGLKFYVSNLIYLIVLFAFFVSIVALLDLLNIFSYNDFSQINKIAGSSIDKSIYIDWNFATIPSFFGIIGVFYFFQKTNSRLQIVMYDFFLIIFSLNIILSGSRRGFILLIVIFLTLITFKFISLFKKNRLLERISSNSSFFLISIISITIILNLFFFHTSYRFKNRTLESLGTKNIGIVKSEISLKLFRYVSVVMNGISFSDFHGRIWTSVFDPKDPDSGWGTRIHKGIFPLNGKNVKIVPEGVIGYLMDSTCNASYYSENNLCESFTLIANLKVIKGDRYKASVYCFVSDSFKVDVASFGVGAANISNNAVSGKVGSSYNFESKGTWQKLEFEFVCNGGDVQIYLSFLKKGVKDFSKIKGYIVFAYPTYEKINNTDNGLSLSITQSKSNYTESGIIDLTKNEVDQKCNESLNQLEEITDANNSYLMAHDTVIQYDIIPSITVTSDAQKYYSSGIFCFPLSILIASDSIQNDTDPIRNWASKFISEDTTYYPYKANIVLDTISNSFIGDRVSRWEFAFKIYINEYSWKQKIFGGGFNFLNWFGYYFLKDKTTSDWPHNPFLSVLLYSGIFGLFIYCFFLYKVFFYYIKYIKQYPILFIFFLTTFFFAFFSAGSPFDPPIMGFFVILPFFIHSIHKKKEPELDDDHINQEIGSIS